MSSTDMLNAAMLGTPEPKSDDACDTFTGLEDLLGMDIEDFEEKDEELLDIQDELEIEDEVYPDDPRFELEDNIDISTNPLPAHHNAKSHIELRDKLQPWAMSLGFTLVIDKSNLKRVNQNCILMCIRSKEYRLAVSKELAPYLNKRLPTSYRDKCPFRLELMNIGTIENPSWISNNPSPEHSIHNHPPISHAGFAPARRMLLALQPKAQEMIDNLTMLGTNPKQILLQLREKYPSLPLNLRDIYNRRFYRLAKARIGQTSTEVALKKLDRDQELFIPFFNSKKQLTGLVYTSHEARALVLRYSTVLFMDCTYKTNKFRLPLLHIVGMTATNHTFTAAVAFIISEKGQWYTQALQAFLSLCGGLDALQTKVIITDREPALHNAIKATFGPSIRIHLCIFHIIQNLRSNSMPSFKGWEPMWRKALTKFKNDWLNLVVSAKTPEELELGHGKLQFQYKQARYKEAIRYVKTLRDIEDRFVNCFTDQYRHFGQRANSRIEGAHAILKNWLLKSTGDISYVLEGLKLHFRSQWEGICGEMDSQISRRSLWNPPVTQEVKRHLSRHAERLIRPQILKANAAFKLRPRRPPTPSCTNTFTTCFGLPCAHKLYEFMLKDLTITSNMIHPQWKLLSRKQLDTMVNQARERSPKQLSLEQHINMIVGSSEDDSEESEADSIEIYEDEAFNNTSQAFFDPPFIRRQLEDDIEAISSSQMDQSSPQLPNFPVPPWISQDSQLDSQFSQKSTQRSRRQDSEGFIESPVVHSTGRIASQHERLLGVVAKGRICSGCHKQVLDHDIRTCPEGNKGIKGNKGNTAKRQATGQSTSQSKRNKT